jgi:hypothetical protein
MPAINVPNMVVEPGVLQPDGQVGNVQNGGQQVPLPTGGTPGSNRGRVRSRSSNTRRRTQTPLAREPSMRLNFGEQTQQQPQQQTQPTQQPFGIGNFFNIGTPATQQQQQQQQQQQHQQQQQYAPPPPPGHFGNYKHQQQQGAPTAQQQQQHYGGYPTPFLLIYMQLYMHTCIRISWISRQVYVSGARQAILNCKCR